MAQGFMGWKMLLNLSPDDGAGTGVEGATGATDDQKGNEGATGAGNEPNDTGDDGDSAAEIARLKAELARANAAKDKAAKEAGDYRKQLRSKMSVDEAAAEEKRIAEEALNNELKELRKKFAVVELSKTAMVLGSDEATSEKIASMLYGAEDADGALREIQKLWTAKEKALRLEFSKVPAPSSGNAEGPTLTREQLSAMTYQERVDFYNKHPEEYNKLMGR